MTFPATAFEEVAEYERYSLPRRPHIGVRDRLNPITT